MRDNQRTMFSIISTITTAIAALKGLGFAGRVGYVAGLSLWTLLCLPTTPIELASGFVFPLWLSTGLSVAGKTAGSLLAFILGRRFLKPLITRMLGKSESGPVHRHLLRELRERPIQTMSILRAAPLPTPFKIYGLCLFPDQLVPLPSYFFGACDAPIARRPAGGRRDRCPLDRKPTTRRSMHARTSHLSEGASRSAAPRALIRRHDPTGNAHARMRRPPQHSSPPSAPSLHRTGRYLTAAPASLILVRAQSPCSSTRRGRSSGRSRARRRRRCRTPSRVAPRARARVWPCLRSCSRSRPYSERSRSLRASPRLSSVRRHVRPPR